jgi:oligoendopeptidase F
MAINVGGQIERALELMSKNDLYDISDSKNKYNSSFEVYFYDYDQPYVFLSPTGTELDHLSFAHEFGHFCNDYVSGGSVAGIDTAEVFSQGMEYLSLIYSDPSQELKLHKLADSLCVFVEQAAYASFEQQVYCLRGEELTLENVIALYEKTGTAYGFDSWQWDSRDFVAVTHFYTSPMYIISYVVSNDAAMQLYQLERENPGSGLAVLEANLATDERYLRAFLETAGLESPFAEGRLKTVRETFETVFG